MSSFSNLTPISAFETTPRKICCSIHSFRLSWNVETIYKFQILKNKIWTIDLVLAGNSIKQKFFAISCTAFDSIESKISTYRAKNFSQSKSKTSIYWSFQDIFRVIGKNLIRNIIQKSPINCQTHPKKQVLGWDALRRYHSYNIPKNLS